MSKSLKEYKLSKLMKNALYKDTGNTSNVLK